MKGQQRKEMLRKAGRKAGGYISFKEGISKFLRHRVKFSEYRSRQRASHVALVVKNPPANAGDIRDVGSVPGWGRPLEKDMATHSSILAWRSPWTEGPRGV